MLKPTLGADGIAAFLQHVLRPYGTRAAGHGLTIYFASDPTEIRLSVSAAVRRKPGGSEILLMQRGDNGHWGLPGGYVEPGEPTTPEETLAIEFVSRDALPEPFVPIHRIRVADAFEGAAHARIR
jgi:8-oxo-dGTP pyrophosphatase MutT (NUDIX family)